MDNELALLEQDEREATALLREAQQKKRALLEEQAKLLELQEAEARAQYAAKLKPVAELSVMGVMYSKLRGMTGLHTMLGVVRVHPDVFKLLKVALVARSETEFYQLAGGLATRLAHLHNNFRQVVEQLRGDAATAKYFEGSQRTSPVFVVSKLPLSEAQSEMYAALLSAYALEFGRITNYEENE